MIWDVRSSGPYGHICWFYDDPATFDSQARDFLAEGLASGERVRYVAAYDRLELGDRAAHLRFIDHRSLMNLRAYARRRGATAILHTSRSAAARLVELMDLSRVRVEVAR